MEAPLYQWDGTVAGSLALPDILFADEWRPALVHQVFVGMRANARRGTAHTKTRGEVSGGGRKPWRQKGLGRARHGSIRSPLWRGGGVAHGPRATKNYHHVLPRKMRARALTSLLTRKLNEGEAIFLTPPPATVSKTRDAAALIRALGAQEGFEALVRKERNAGVVVLPRYDGALMRAFRNLPAFFVVEARELGVHHLLQKRFVLFIDAPAAVEALAQRVERALASRKRHSTVATPA